jgi:chromate transporter
MGSGPPAATALARGPQVADAETLLGEGTGRPAPQGALRAAAAALALWLVPVLALVLAMPGSVFADIAAFFSRMAVVTFGGAYAVLAYVGQEAVGTYGWLTAPQMMDGLAMAETTPGPLIMVLQFVGFMGAWAQPGGLDPLLAATLGGLLATWVTFAPCFAWIFLGAPYMERLRESRGLSAALAGVTAAVVGVIANLAFWFALHVIWAEVGVLNLGPISLDWPSWASLSPWALVLTALSLGAVFLLRTGMTALLLGAATAGIALGLAGQI